MIIIIAVAALALRCSSQSESGVAVVELFTSQGCSSCPIADRHLSALISSADSSGQNIFGLSFHVTYWNNLGWEDPYSQQAFTNRQRKYSDALGGGLYTPEMVINGTSRMVGSNRQEAASVIATWLKRSPVHEITVMELRFDGDSLALHYRLNNRVGAGEVINIAIVERNVENDVLRGENSGKHLHHDNVVRTFVSESLKAEDKVLIPFPDTDRQNARVIIYSQDRQGHVTGAAGCEI